ncbi:hypothetical protein F511_33549 [Dorcoceras hygrometricum]|uniref:Uncharacterized protein n=1 Tax=Dorcoceras hygrometricum TaxID=472368 RepID=A0A2Z7BA76_9LAMI|nr:hypothetical protein F511_33549 [Dorcoceras hygrometricum]
MTGRETPSSACTRRPDEISVDGNSSKSWSEQVRRWAAAAARGCGRKLLEKLVGASPAMGGGGGTWQARRRR